MAASREHHKVRLEPRAVIERRGEPVVASFDLRDRGLEPQAETAFAHLVSEADAQVVVEAAQQLRTPMDQRHGRSQAIENPCKFDRDITAPDDDYARREAIE